MAQNGLFTFTYPKTEHDIVKTDVKLNRLYQIFDGHFPGHPVLPAVCMLQMVKDVVEAHISKKNQNGIGSGFEVFGGYSSQRKHNNSDGVKDQY